MDRAGARGTLSGRVKRFRFYPRARRGVPWFDFGRGVEYELVPALEPALLPDGDALFATAWGTAAIVAAAERASGAGFYLVQSYETWDGPREEVDAAFRLPLHKIVVARWLGELSASFGEAERTTYVPNAIDSADFFVTNPISERPARVGMLWHEWPIKGGLEGLEALALARDRIPSLEVVLFGTPKPPPGLPPWISYVRSPRGESLRRLYNSFAIFLHPSRLEGWPLPPAEAMACGCALVAAANDGMRDFAVDGQTAALAPIEDAQALAEGIVSLLQDPARRERLAKSGVERSQTFDWKRSVDRLESVLTNQGKSL